MEAERLSNAGAHPAGLSFIRNDVKWVVWEADARGVPGSNGSTALIFDSRDMTRRVWVFPRNWQQLNANELWALSERSAKISPRFDHKSHDLSATLYASLVAINRGKELIARARIAASENHALHEECRKLAAACRNELDKMRGAVESHATDLRTAGLTAEDASLSVANAVREIVAELQRSDDSAVRLESDTNRWCANAYRAA